MKKPTLKSLLGLLPFVICSLAAGMLLVALDRPWGQIPALGRLLNPWHGFWRNAESGQLPKAAQFHVDGLNNNVVVKVDERRVPHLFAKDDLDLAHAQGFVTARDRLWQMEIQVIATAGRLAEKVGPGALEHDITQHKRGIPLSAQATAQALEKADPLQYSLLQAYAEGVNSYVNSLNRATLPLEYKIMGYTPEQWTPVKSILLQKQMAWDLSGGSDDLRMSNNLQKFTLAQLAELFPDHPVNAEPVVPIGTRFSFSAQNPEQPPLQMFKLDGLLDLSKVDRGPNRANGSNNWAVSGKKTASHLPMLANDPHLGLRLPSIWYELQLHAPGVNVYGATLPGAPGVVIGMNEKIAWGVTNAGTDVVDYYKIQFRDDLRKEYWHDNQWKPSTLETVEIYVKGQKSVTLPIVYTHFGPVALEIPYTNKPNSEKVSLAMRWTGNDVSAEFTAFYKINRAQNMADFRKALFGYLTPAQNFVGIDGLGNIGMWHNGKMPVRWQDQGKFVSDGTLGKYDWNEFIRFVQLPSIENPSHGFVSSANQHPVDSTYPYSLVGSWNPTSYMRARRINEQLAQKNDFTSDDFQKMQVDNLDAQARRVTPFLLSLLDQKNLTDAEKDAVARMQGWDFVRAANSVEATLYDEWWKGLRKQIWTNHFSIDSFQFPYEDVTAEMILGRQIDKWADNPTTPEPEALADVARLSFQKALKDLSAKQGPLGEKWQWGIHRGTDILHLAKIPGMGVSGLPTGGSSGTVNAQTHDHGPSWRMVISFEPGGGIRGKGIYPGGQSGNPGSPYYSNMIPAWLKGELHDFHFMKDANESLPEGSGEFELGGYK